MHLGVLMFLFGHLVLGHAEQSRVDELAGEIGRELMTRAVEFEHRQVSVGSGRDPSGSGMSTIYIYTETKTLLTRIRRTYGDEVEGIKVTYVHTGRISKCGADLGADRPSP